MRKVIPLCIAGSWEHGPAALEVVQPYDGSLAGRATYASAEQVERAFAAAHVVRAEAAALPLHVRADRPKDEAALRRHQGVRDGREGVRYTMTDLTYERVMVLTGLDL